MDLDGWTSVKSTQPIESMDSSLKNLTTVVIQSVQRKDSFLMTVLGFALGSCFHTLLPLTEAVHQKCCWRSAASVT